MSPIAAAPSPIAPVSVRSPAPSGIAGGFAQALAEASEPEAPAVLPAERQDLAGAQSELPDETPADPQALLAWLPTVPIAPIAPVPPIVAESAFPVEIKTADLPDGVVALPGALTTSMPTAAPLTETVEAPAGEAAIALDTPPRAALPAKPHAPAPPTAPVETPRAPAAQHFAAAMFASTALEAADPARPAMSDTPAPILGSTTDLIRGLAVAAVAQAQGAPLDMGRDTWPGNMLDRIEMLRDAADARDTRIRLSPDMLGSVDVSIRTEGDKVHVRFNAEHQSTRILLADAAPKLHELAESRGLKLGQTSVDGGDAGAREQPRNQTSNLPDASAAVTAAGADGDTDQRIA
jgi:flagellar hook-length control protein FliK